MSRNNKLRIINAPVVTLHGINVQLILEKYIAGHYNDTIPSLEKNEGVLEKIKEIKSHNAPVNPIHVNYVDVNGEVTETVRTKNSEINETKKNKKPCYYCLKRFDHKHLGIVIDTHQHEETDIFYIENILCDGECLRKYLEQINIDKTLKDRYIYLTELMLERLYPGEKIRKADDFRLIKENSATGEGLAYEKWKRSSHKYVKVIGVKIIPVDTEYIIKK